MALTELTIVYTSRGTFPDPDEPSLTLARYRRTVRAYDDGPKTVSTTTEDIFQPVGEPAPLGYSKPGSELVDSYQVPTATTAPGYKAGEEGKQATVYHAGIGTLTINYAAACDLELLSISATATTSAGTATGTVTVQLGGTAAVKSVRLTNGNTFQTDYYPVDAQGFYTFENVPAGSYLAQANDDSPGLCAVSGQVSVPAFARVGCRDPSASNYDELASEDGVCTYAPVQAQAILSFPEAQALRILVPPLPGYGSADQLTPDNTLLAEQRLPGVTQPGYCQKVTRRDEVQVQFKSTFTSHLVHLVACGSNAVVATFPPRRILLGQGNVATFGVYLTAHTSTAQARLYFQAAVLPLPLLPGNRLELSGFGVPALEGNVVIIEVKEDTLAGVPYLVLNLPFGEVTALPRLDGQATTTFDVASFDIWQTSLNFAAIAAGCYYLRITATDPTLGSARAVSEPLELAAEHPGTVLVTYRNFDNAHGLNYSFGLLNRLRVSASLFALDTATTKETLIDSASRTTLLTATARRQRRLKTFLLPHYLHEKLALAFAHDLVTVQGEEWVGEEKYEYPALQERYGLTNGQITLTQAEGLGTGNGDDLGDINQGQGFIIANEGYLRY